MRSWKPDKMKSVMKKKGYVQDKAHSTDHDVYIISNPETGKRIQTKFSRGAHGKDSLGPSLMSSMAREMGFESVSEFDRYLSCHISEAEYRKMMSERGLLNRKRRSPKILYSEMMGPIRR